MMLNNHRIAALQTMVDRTHGTLLDHAQAVSDVVAIWDQIKGETSGQPDISAIIIERNTLKAEVENLRHKAAKLEIAAEVLAAENARLRYYESCMRGMGRR